ncbi:MAG: hypothetical protein MKZ71_06505 [Acidimicrobiales bacterium]|nr:hypothetical protein [Acidimicrobiales bacterium]
MVEESESSSNQSELPESFSIPSALPSIPARVIAFSAVIVAGLCGGLMGFALARLQWEENRDALVLAISCSGSLVASFGVAIVCVLALRAMAEWNDVAPLRSRRKQ